jgi:hypothetical protein
MSTLVTSVRQSVVGHWLISAFAAAVVIAALATSLVVTLSDSGSASGSATSPAATIGDTGLLDNSYCLGTNRTHFGAC